MGVAIGIYNGRRLAGYCRRFATILPLHSIISSHGRAGKGGPIIGLYMAISPFVNSIHYNLPSARHIFYHQTYTKMMKW